MPLTAVAHHSLTDDDLNARLAKLYDTSPEFADGEAAVNFFKSALSKGDVLYAGMFNDKPVCAVAARGQGEVRTIQFIVVHLANRGRGLASELIRQVCEDQLRVGAKRFEAGCGAIHRILTELGYL